MLPKTKLVIGLGNPGTRYQHTRHNIGFLVIDALHNHLSMPEWKERKILSAHVAEGGDDDRGVILGKPTTFMNESGKAVVQLVKKYPRAELVVIHDDLDLAFGKIKISRNSSSAGHNGVQSIINALGTKDFTRVRIGIGRPSDGTPADEFVLHHFTPEELSALPEIIGRAVNTDTLE